MEAAHVLEVTDATFATDVLEASHDRPVVVDFWAEWCAPCRTLGPVLEGLAAARGGAFVLAKVDVDRNPTIAQEFRVMSIPTVKAFVDGRMVDEFTGALPEPQVRQWLDAIVPSRADELAAQARALAAGGEPEAAEAAFRAVLRDEPGNVAAILGLAALLVERGEHDEAERLATPLLPDPGAKRVLAAIRVDAWAGEEGDDPRSRARRLAASGRWEEALDAMLDLVAGEREVRDDVLAIFEVLGDEDAVTRAYRPRLASALF